MVASSVEHLGAGVKQLLIMVVIHFVLRALQTYKSASQG